MNTFTLASLFKSLSEPVRLRIMTLLLDQGELCVCELVDTLNLSQSVVSRHLAYLRNNQLVTSKREGAWMYYRINTDTSTDMTFLFQFMKQCIEGNSEIKTDLENLNQYKLNQRQCVNG
jgi:ArsR family transcriptional regulator, arsenate/arsenite/antimonite-responsive transcriptional repressor